MKTKFMTVRKDKVVTLSFNDLSDACLEMVQDLFVMKSKKTPNTLLIIPYDMDYDENVFEKVYYDCRFTSAPFIFNVNGLMDVEEGDELKLDIGDFGIFITKGK